MERMRNDDKSLEGLIDLAIYQCQKRDIDCVYEFNRRHRLRRPPGRIDDAPETSHTPTLRSHYRKELMNMLVRLCREF